MMAISVAKKLGLEYASGESWSLVMQSKFAGED